MEDMKEKIEAISLRLENLEETMNHIQGELEEIKNDIYDDDEDDGFNSGEEE